MTATLKGLFAALGAFALFSTHDAVIKSLGATYEVFQIIFFSMLFAFVPMSIIMLADKAIDNFRPHYPVLVLCRAGLSIVAMSCAFYAFTVLPLAETYSLLFATPLLVTALSVPLLGETVRMQRWGAVVVGLIGVLIVLRPGLTELTPGHFAGLTAAAASAMSSILARKLGGKERPAVLILFPMLLSMPVMSMTLPVVYVPVTLPDLGLMAIVGFL
ncbi:MAG: DMT family transporter, partial [Pseudomonadota bacterium]